MKVLHISRLILLAAIVMTGKKVSAQIDLNALMHERNEYYFSLSIDDVSDLQAINALCSVDGTDGKTAVCYANSEQYAQLLEKGYQPVLMTPPSMRKEVEMYDPQRGIYDWNTYLTYSQYVTMMQDFPSSALSDRTCTFLDLGTLSTTNNRKILGVRLNNGQPDGKPKFLYTSTMHGDEVTGMILMLRLINEFCTSTDSRILNLLENLDIFIFPCTNPDGTYYGGKNTVNGARRYNGNGVDLNRHFPDFDDGPHPDGASYYQDEAQWMMNLAQEYLFTMSANYHGGAEVMNYPWDTYSALHPDDAWWQLVCHEYADLTHQFSSDYMDIYNDGITNGYAWYTINGSRQDYMNYYAQCREVTIECSNDKTPNASELPKFWNYNHNSMLAYMEQCLNGVHGLVYDAETLQPIAGAAITVQGHDHHGSSVTTHNVGDFHRPIKGGTYTLEITKDGYCPQFIDVTIADNERLDLDTVFLEPGSCLLPNFSASSTSIAPGQSINFTDMSFGDIVSWDWTFEGATPSTSTDQNPSNITYDALGNYDVTLTITDAEGNSETLTKSDYIEVKATYNMQNGTFQTCSALFFDSGGPDENYGNGLNYVMTFLPEDNANKVSVSFTSFELENNWDFLYIYDGTSTSATQIGKYSGTTSPGTITATNASGALTFKFTSDSSVTKSGWIANITCTCTINASANPIEGGQVTGEGIYNYGETCTLTATADEGFFFSSWTEDGETVSTDAIYTFDVTGNRTLVANFTSDYTITDELTEGWNWWSTSIEADSTELLNQLKEALGANGLKITSQSEGYISYYPQTNAWYGTLTAIEPGKMYKIQTSAACTISLSGNLVNPAESPITLSPGYTWIGFIGTEEVEINAALANLSPANSDMIKSNNLYAIYIPGRGWTGSLTSLKPGKGYIYNSKATDPKTFVFPSASSKQQ